MTPFSKPPEQLFERDLAAILSCDKGTAGALPPAPGRQLWLLPLIIAAFGGFAALHLQNRSQPAEAPILSNAEPRPPSRPFATPEAKTEAPKAVAPVAVEAPAVRARIVTKSREARRPHRPDRREMVSYQKSPTSILPITGEGLDLEKATTNGPDMEAQSARDEKQRQARLEAIDAVRALRLR